MNKIHAEEIADKLITISEQPMRRYTVTPWLDDDGKPQIDIEETNDVVFNGTPMSNDEWLNSDRRVWYRDDIVDFKIEALQKRIAELEKREYGATFLIKRLIENYDSLPIDAQSEFPGTDIDDARSFLSEGGGEFCEWKHQDRRRHLYSTSCGMKDVLRPYPNNIGKLVHDYCGKPIRLSKTEEVSDE